MVCTVTATVVLVLMSMAAQSGIYLCLVIVQSHNIHIYVCLTTTKPFVAFPDKIMNLADE